ncbi:hypothetical protein [Halalkalicoccus subterraneus]|nr:hypothetical protein [Halalkalicoccus subterraneus]
MNGPLSGPRAYDGRPTTNSMVVGELIVVVLVGLATGLPLSVV